MAHRYHAASRGGGGNRSLTSGHNRNESRLAMVTTLVRDSKAYPATTEAIVVRQVVDALRQCYTLVARLATYTSNSGASQRLLSLMGTIPIHFRGSQYNIPITLWIMSYHPNGAPKVYVTPTSGMVVRSRHRHVDAQGLVYLPYLSEWDPSNSRIEELIGVMVSVFSQDPPVYARKHGSSSSSSSSSVDRPLPAVGSGGSASTRVSGNNSSAVSSASGRVGSGNVAVVTGGLGRMGLHDNEKERLVEMVKERVRAELEGVTQAGEREMLALLEEKEKLEGSLKHNDESIGKERIKEGIEKEIELLEKDKVRLEEWIKMNKIDEGDLKVENIMVPQDGASEQVLECVAKDYALQDAMDALDEGVEAELMDSETFVKEIRKLARDQFMARALLRKVKLKQAQKVRERQGNDHVQMDQFQQRHLHQQKQAPIPRPPSYPAPSRTLPIPMYRQ